MRNSKLHEFADTLLDATAMIASDETRDVIAQNYRICKQAIMAVHARYPDALPKICKLKRDLIAQYAINDEVSEQSIGLDIVVDYDFGENRQHVYQQLNNLVGNIEARRRIIDNIWAEDSTVEFIKVDEQDIPAEMRESLEPIIETRAVELIG